ncbi:MAG: replication initiation protein [Microviridae sp.]|nr:MAG: replication initiation protein [Microviridae sp.]
MCLYPIKIRNPGYDSLVDCQHRSPFAFCGGPIPPDYEVDVPCGHCWQCKRNQRFDLVLRLKAELAVIPPGTRGYFVTLTFDNSSLSRWKSSYATPLRRWLDLLRKRYGSFRYYFLSEFGTRNTRRFHFHGLILGMRDVPYSELCSSWRYGRSWFGWCTDRTCGYITKYMTKQWLDPGVPYCPVKVYSKSIGYTPACLSWIRSHLAYSTPDSPAPFKDCVVLPGSTRPYMLGRRYVDKLYGRFASIVRRTLLYMSGSRWVYRGVKYFCRDLWYRAIVSSRSDYDLSYSLKRRLFPEVPLVRIPADIQFKFNLSNSPNLFCYGT